MLAVSMLANLLAAKKVATIDEIMKFPIVLVSGNRVFLKDKFTFHAYSLPDFKYIKKFGKEGSGPGEFKAYASSEIFPDKLVVTSAGKVVLFSLDGNLIEEIRLKKLHREIYPVGKNFVASIPHKTAKSIAIYNRGFKPVKTIYEGGMGNFVYYDGSRKKRDMQVIKDFVDYRVYNGQIFIGDSSKGFFVTVYDSSGKKQYEIDKKYEKIKVSPEYKEFKMKKIRQERRYNFWKTIFNYVFPEYLPAFRDFYVKGGIMYFITPLNLKNDKVVVTDLKGKTLKTCIVPHGFYDNRVISYIDGDKLYYVVENDDEEAWELHVEDLK
jgi:hypothetical protein